MPLLKRLFPFILALFITLSVNAQSDLPAGRIGGRIIDSLTGKPIDFASIGLLNEENKEVNGTTTDEKGVFMIDHVPFGNYKVTVYYIGYKTTTTAIIGLNASKPAASIGNIMLANSQVMLSEVEVVGKTEIIENKVDKIVYNAENDVTAQGGAAIDILKKVPQVTVDVDGNVELQGNPNVRFLINGKPSSIFGSSLADALASIPAGQIKSIEVITSPGAKYDAQGTGGIINIVLKDNKIKGINGSVNLSAGSRFETGSLNLNYKNGNFGVNAFFSGNAQLNSHTPNSQSRSSIDPATNTTTRLVQDGYTDFQRMGYRTGMGFDWSLNKSNSITGSFAYNQFSNRNKSMVNQWQDVYDASSGLIQEMAGYRNSDSKGGMSAVDWNLNYKKNFKKEGQSLDITYTSSYGLPVSSYVQTQSYNGNNRPYAGIAGSNPGSDNETTVAVDYAHPLSDNFMIETGVKTVQQHIRTTSNVSLLDVNSDVYTTDPLQSYKLRYDMAVYAAYVSTTFKLLKWLDVRAGARAEHTDLSIDFPGTSIPSYNILVPSLILSHQFQKSQSVKLAYSRRIERPEYGELNPFMNLSDPRNITTGNPALKPEIGDNFELGYSRNLEKRGGNIYIGLIERINSQDLKQVTAFYPGYLVGDSVYTNVSITTRQNIGEEYNSGGIVSGTIPITDKLSIRGNFIATHRYIVSPLYVGNLSMGMRYRANATITYQFPKDLVVEAFGNYNSAARNIQGKNPQSITYTFAMRKQFWKRKASIGITATNPFNKYVRQETTIVTDTYSSTSVRLVPYRSFGVTFSYKFGKVELKKDKEEHHDYLNGPPTGN